MPSLPSACRSLLLFSLPSLRLGSLVAFREMPVLVQPHTLSLSLPALFSRSPLLQTQKCVSRLQNSSSRYRGTGESVTPVSPPVTRVVRKDDKSNVAHTHTQPPPHALVHADTICRFFSRFFSRHKNTFYALTSFFSVWRFICSPRQRHPGHLPLRSPPTEGTPDAPLVADSPPLEPRVRSPVVVMLSPVHLRP